MKQEAKNNNETQEVGRAELPDGQSYDKYAGIGDLVHDVVHAWELEGVEQDKIKPIKAWWIVEGCYTLLQLEAVTLCRKLGLKGFNRDEVTTEAFECLRQKIGRFWYDEEREKDYYKDHTIGYLFFCMREYMTATYRQRSKEKKTAERMVWEGVLAMSEEDIAKEIIDLDWFPKLRKAANDCLREMSRTNRDVWRWLLKGYSLTEVAEKLGRSISDVYRAKERSKPQLVSCLARKGLKL